MLTITLLHAFAHPMQLIDQKAKVERALQHLHRVEEEHQDFSVVGRPIVDSLQRLGLNPANFQEAAVMLQREVAKHTQRASEVNDIDDAMRELPKQDIPESALELLLKLGMSGGATPNQARDMLQEEKERIEKDCLTEDADVFLSTPRDVGLKGGSKLCVRVGQFDVGTKSVIWGGGDNFSWVDLTPWYIAWLKNPARQAASDSGWLPTGDVRVQLGMSREVSLERDFIDVMRIAVACAAGQRLCLPTAAGVEGVVTVRRLRHDGQYDVQFDNDPGAELPSINPWAENVRCAQESAYEPGQPIALYRNSKSAVTCRWVSATVNRTCTGFPSRYDVTVEGGSNIVRSRFEPA